MSDELGNVLDQPRIEKVRRTVDLELIASSVEEQDL
jgi:hypothetical protein